MRIDVISVQPKMLEGFLTESILGRAVEKGICEINLVDLREFGEGRWRKVDDKPYGGGPGMLMKCGPWFAAVESCLGGQAEKAGGGGETGIQPSPGANEAQRKERTGEETGIQPSPGANEAQRKERTGELHIIMTSPAGKVFTQRDAEYFANLSTSPSTPNPQLSTFNSQLSTFSPHLIFLCGHYEGFDARIETLATDIFSVGDFVMTGGELAAAAMVDSIVRLLPGVLGGGPAAISSESFSLRGDSQPSALNSQLLLEPPQYTHPPEFRGMKVPEVLLSGDHAKIEAWRRREARKRTERLRPDMIKYT